MCSSCNWEELLGKIDCMMESGDYDWAADTLEGIKVNVSNWEHCTEGQVSAVRNIEESVSP